MSKGKKPASYEDLEALPIGWVGEILEEELFASPRPAVGHVHAASALNAELWRPFALGRGGPGGWWIVQEPELHLGRDVLVPDLAGWRRERMARPPAPEEPAVTLAPDWVCEVLSPSTAAVDRTRKLPRYHRAGVGHVWLVDPLARTLDVLRREAAGWLLVSSHAGNTQVCAEPFDVRSLELGLLWLPGRETERGREGP